MPPSVLTVDTLYWDTVGGLILAAICFIWLVHLCRVGDLRVFYRWMRSWLPTKAPKTDAPETPYLLSGCPIYPSHLPSVKTFDHDNFAASHSGTVIDIASKRKVG